MSEDDRGQESSSSGAPAGRTIPAGITLSKAEGKAPAVPPDIIERIVRKGGRTSPRTSVPRQILDRDN